MAKVIPLRAKGSISTGSTNVTLKSSGTIYYSDNIITDTSGNITLAGTISSLAYSSSNVSIPAGKFFMIDSKSSDLAFFSALTNGSYATIVSPFYGRVEAGASNWEYVVINKSTVKKVVSFVVSDKESAYPDGGEKDGYWYEKVSVGIPPEVLGCTKVAIDTVTFASDQAFMSGGVKYYLPHSLGEIPKHAILWAQTDITTYVYPGYLQGFDVRKNEGLHSYACANWLIEDNATFTCELRGASFTADNIFINGGVFKAGVEYKLITMV